MSQRKRDTTLADGFTKTKHSQPSEILDVENNKLLEPLTMLVIGASRGIGEGIVYAYARAGAASLILAARESSAAELSTVEQRARELSPNTRITSLHVDITSSESVAALAKGVQERVGGKLDIVVLNSGYAGPVVLKIEDGDPKDFHDVFGVNVHGTYLVAHHFVPLLRESKGANMFIAVGSFAACIINGHIANTGYCISKFAQVRLVEFLSEQYGADGLLAIAVHPGAVNTESADKTTPESFRPCKFGFIVLERKESAFLTIVDLTDDVGLCGAFCVWLSREKRMWLNGRLISATWDVDELIAKRGKIESQDLLKFSYRVGDASAAGQSS